MAKKPMSAGNVAKAVTAYGSYKAGQAIGKAMNTGAKMARTVGSAVAQAAGGKPKPVSDARSARVDYTPPTRVAPKVQPNQEAAGIFGALKQKRQTVLDALSGGK